MKSILQQALDFTDEDLQANREGYMTKRQRKNIDQIRTEMRFVQFVGVGMGIIFLFGCAIWLDPVCFGLMALSIPLTIFASVSQSRRASRDLYKGMVLSIDERIKLIKQREGLGYIRCYVQAGEGQFRISKRAYKSLQNRGFYRIYFAPNTSKILSIEALKWDSNLLDETEDRDIIQDLGYLSDASSSEQEH